MPAKLAKEFAPLVAGLICRIISELFTITVARLAIAAATPPQNNNPHDPGALVYVAKSRLPCAKT